MYSIPPTCCDARAYMRTCHTMPCTYRHTSICTMQHVMQCLSTFTHDCTLSACCVSPAAPARCGQSRLVSSRCSNKFDSGRKQLFEAKLCAALHCNSSIWFVAEYMCARVLPLFVVLVLVTWIHIHHSARVPWYCTLLSCWLHTVFFSLVYAACKQVVTVRFLA